MQSNDLKKFKDYCYLKASLNEVDLYKSESVWQAIKDRKVGYEQARNRRKFNNSRN